MKKTQASSKAHLFVCCNEKAEGPCCHPLGATELFTELKTRAKAQYPDSIKVTRSRCLGICEEGIAAVLYSPKKAGQYFLNAKTSDQEELWNELTALL